MSVCRSWNASAKRTTVGSSTRKPLLAKVARIARRREPGQQGFARPHDERTAQRETLEDDEEIDRGDGVPGACGRREEEQEEGRPERRAQHDVSDPPAPARPRPVAEVAGDR